MQRRWIVTIPFKVTKLTSVFYHTNTHTAITVGLLQPLLAQQRGALQLLDSMDAAAAQRGTTYAAPDGGVPEFVTRETQIVAMPTGFMDDFAARFDEEGLDDIIGAIGASIPSQGHAALAVVGTARWIDACMQVLPICFLKRGRL
jgi:hypothetical protein